MAASKFFDPTKSQKIGVTNRRAIQVFIFYSTARIAVVVVGSMIRDWSEPWTRSRNIANTLYSWRDSISQLLPQQDNKNNNNTSGSQTDYFNCKIRLCLLLEQEKEVASKLLSQKRSTPIWPPLQHPRPSSSARCPLQMGRSSLATEL